MDLYEGISAAVGVDRGFRKFLDPRIVQDMEPGAAELVYILWKYTIAKDMELQEVPPEQREARRKEWKELTLAALKLGQARLLTS